MPDQSKVNELATWSNTKLIITSYGVLFVNMTADMLYIGLVVVMVALMVVLLSVVIALPLF